MSVQHRYDTSVEIPSLMLDVNALNPVTGIGTIQRAKIDTGADLTRLPETLKQGLALLPFSQRTFRYGNNTSEEKPTYLCVIEIDGFKIDAEVYFGEFDYILVGRNVLNHLKMLCHGKNQIFTLEDP